MARTYFHDPSSRPVTWPIARLMVLVLILFAYRAVVQIASGVPLHYDEAQYYGWSLAPTTGYYSKPPMIAWSIWAARSVCGESEACVRIPALLALMVSSIMVALTAKTLAGARAAWWTGLLFMTMPLVSFYSGVITTDSLLLMYWSIAMFAFIRASDGGGLGWWVLTGIAAGLGLLSKYTMGVFAISALLWLVIDPKARRTLTTAGPWFGALLAALVWSPNIRWQMQHKFATVQHTVEISKAGDTARGAFSGLIEFLAAQPLLFGVVFAMALLGAWPMMRARAVEERYARAIRFGWTFCWPMLLVISIQAFSTRAHANWAAAGYAGAALAAGVAVTSLRNGRRWMQIGLLINVVLLMMVAHGPMVVGAIQKHLPQVRNPYAQLLGWRELGTEVRSELLADPKLRLLSNERRILSELIYYARPMAYPVHAWNPERKRTDHYRLLYDVAERPQAAYLFVGETGKFDLELLKQHFEQVIPLTQFKQPIGQDKHAEFELIRVETYRGPR